MIDILARGMAAKALQIGAPTDQQIEDAVSALADEGKITAGATAAQADQIESNKTMVGQLSEALEKNINTQALWESGHIISGGLEEDYQTRIRTIDCIPENVVWIKTDGEAKVRAFLYDADGAFVAISSLGWVQAMFVPDVLAEQTQAVQMRVVVQSTTVTQVIDTTYSEHIELIVMTDRTLSRAGEAGDAKMIGGEITKLQETNRQQMKRLAGLDGVLDTAWECGHIKTSDGTDGLSSAANFTKRIRSGFLPDDVRKISTDEAAALYVFRYDMDGNFVDYKEYSTFAEVRDFDHSTYRYRISLRDGASSSNDIDLSYVEHVTVSCAVKRSLVTFDIDHNMRDVSDALSGVDLSTDALPETLEQVYELFDGLVTAHPDYVTKSDAAQLCSMSYPTYANGVTSSGTYDITPAYKTYLYSFCESNTYAGNDGTCKKAKLLIVCGVHGSEYAAPYNAYLFAKQLCDGILSDVNFFKLRAAFDVYILPCLNGYGLYHNLRTNANGVNLNRNFPVLNWTLAEEDTDDYTGASAGSEFETQLAMAITAYLKPDIVIDHHNYSRLQRQFYTTVCDDRWLGLMYQSLVDCSIAFKKQYPDYFGSGYSLLINQAGDAPASVSKSTSKGTLARWCYEKGILFSSTVEVSNSINFVGGVYSDAANDYMGMSTFSVAEYTLRNVILRAGQWTLDNR